MSRSRSRGKNSSGTFTKLTRQGRKVPRALRLNAVLSKRKRVLLPYCGTKGAPLTMVPGTDYKDWGGARSLLYDGNTSMSSTATYGRMSSYLPAGDGSINAPNLHGHDFMFTMYQHAMCVGVKYEVDVLCVTGGPVRIFAFAVGMEGADSSPVTGIANLTEEMFCPPYQRQEYVYMKHKQIAPTTSNQMIRNALTGYIPYKLVRQGTTWKDRMEDETFWEIKTAEGTNGDAVAIFNIGALQSQIGDSTVVLSSKVRLYYDMVFFEALDTAKASG